MPHQTILPATALSGHTPLLPPFRKRTAALGRTSGAVVHCLNDQAVMKSRHLARVLSAKSKSRPGCKAVTEEEQQNAVPSDERQQQKQPQPTPDVSPQILGSVAVVMALGVANRVLYKMVLNPLSDYVFFLAQFQTFSYVGVYFAVLAYKRYWTKTVSAEQLAATDKTIFLYIGAAEALSQVLGFIGASKLPGVVIPLLSQSVLIWQIAVGRVVLGKRLPAFQIAGALLVVAGVCTAAWPGGDGNSVFSEVSLMYAGVYALSMFFPALSAIFKERIFTEAKEKLGGQSLDLFAVNSFGSAAQAGFVFLLLPVLCYLRGLSLGEFPQYLMEGFQCSIGRGPNCDAAPQLAVLYVSCNLGFNIALLNLLRAAGNVVQSLTLSIIVPLTIAAFTLPLPYISDAPQLGTNFIIGTTVLLSGLFVYNSNKYLPALKSKLGSKDS